MLHFTVASSGRARIHDSEEECHNDANTKRNYAEANRAMQKWREERFQRRTAGAVAKASSS
jgi:hypothetical protein